MKDLVEIYGYHNGFGLVKALLSPLTSLPGNQDVMARFYTAIRNRFQKINKDANTRKDKTCARCKRDFDEWVGELVRVLLDHETVYKRKEGKNRVDFMLFTGFILAYNPDRVVEFAKLTEENFLERLSRILTVVDEFIESAFYLAEDTLIAKLILSMKPEWIFKDF